MEQDKVFENYKLAKMNVQMTEAKLESVSIDKDENVIMGDYSNEVSLGYRTEKIDSNQIRGYLKIMVDCKNQKTQQIDLHIEVIYSGLFKAVGKWEEEKLLEWVEAQIVPQLLSYVRSLITNLTTLMKIPPIEIPTMDVFQSLTENNHLNDMNEE